jgi:hypothetical protein
MSQSLVIRVTVYNNSNNNNNNNNNNQKTFSSEIAYMHHMLQLQNRCDVIYLIDMVSFRYIIVNTLNKTGSQ